MRKLLALMLVFCWVTLSGLDLGEELRSKNGGSAYTQESPPNPVSRDIEYRLGLFNNIVELAVTTPHVISSTTLREQFAVVLPIPPPPPVLLEKASGVHKHRILRI